MTPLVKFASLIERWAGVACCERGIAKCAAAQTVTAVDCSVVKIKTGSFRPLESGINGCCDGVGGGLDGAEQLLRDCPPGKDKKWLCAFNGMRPQRCFFVPVVV